MTSGHPTFCLEANLLAGGNHNSLLGNPVADLRYPADGVDRTTIHRRHEVELCLSRDAFTTALGFTKRTLGNAERGAHPPSLGRWPPARRHQPANVQS